MRSAASGAACACGLTARVTVRDRAGNACVRPLTAWLPRSRSTAAAAGTSPGGARLLGLLRESEGEGAVESERPSLLAGGVERCLADLAAGGVEEAAPHGLFGA
jgi:hypothetical protein